MNLMSNSSTAIINQINQSNEVYPRAIKHIRTENKIFLNDLANLLHISHMDLLDYENGRKPMPKDIYDQAYTLLRDLEMEE